MPTSKGRKKPRKKKPTTRHTSRQVPVPGNDMTAVSEFLRNAATDLVSAKKILASWLRGDTPLPADLPDLWDGWRAFAGMARSVLGKVADPLSDAEVDGLRAMAYGGHDQLIEQVAEVLGMAGGTPQECQNRISPLLTLYRVLYQEIPASGRRLFLSQTPLGQVPLPEHALSDTGREVTFLVDLTHDGAADSGGLCVLGSGDDLRIVLWGRLSTPSVIMVTVLRPDTLFRSLSEVAEIVHHLTLRERYQVKVDHLLLPGLVVQSKDQMCWHSAGAILVSKDDASLGEVAAGLGAMFRCLTATRPVDEEPATPPAPSRESSPPSKDHRDRTGSTVSQVPGVRVIDLTTPAPRAGAAGHGNRSRAEPDHRWTVQGFWRNQACGPGRTERRRVWIADHENGPRGKPLREAAPVVRRVDLT